MKKGDDPVFLTVLILVVLILAAVVLTIAYICFRMAFYAPSQPPKDPEIIEIPEGEIYEVHREVLSAQQLI